MPNTVEFHRVLRATPERVYRAFLDADAMAKWLPPNGFTGKVHHLDARVGGTYKMSFTNFTTGQSHSFGGEYLELVPGERLRYTDKFDDPNLPGEMTVTVRLKPVSVGTDVNIVQEGHPGRHPAGGLLPRLAGVADAAREARRGRDSGLASTDVRAVAAAPPDPRADSRVSAIGAGARRAAGAWSRVLSPGGVGRPAGQHAARGAAIAACARVGNDAGELGGAAARAAVGPALQRLRRRRARCAGLHARPPARQRRDAAPGRRPGRPHGAGAGRHTGGPQRGGARASRAAQPAALRHPDRSRADAVGRRHAADIVDGATATDRSARCAARARAPLPARRRPGNVRRLRRLGRRLAAGGGDHLHELRRR